MQLWLGLATRIEPATSRVVRRLWPTRIALFANDPTYAVETYKRAKDNGFKIPPKDCESLQGGDFVPKAALAFLSRPRAAFGGSIGESRLATIDLDSISWPYLRPFTDLLRTPVAFDVGASEGLPRDIALLRDGQS